MAALAPPLRSRPGEPGHSSVEQSAVRPQEKCIAASFSVIGFGHRGVVAAETRFPRFTICFDLKMSYAFDFNCIGCAQ